MRELEPPPNYQETFYLSEKSLAAILATSLSLHREREAVRTSEISEIETAIDTLEREKSHSVHFSLARRTMAEGGTG